MFIIFLFYSSQAFTMQSIPSTGTPPEEFYGSGMVYDELTGCLIIFGGSYSVYGTFSNVLYTFDISVLEWGVLNPESNFLPSPIGSPIVFLTKERILYAMCGINEKGFNSDIFSYNLTSKIWKLVENDIVVPGLSYTVNTQFEWNGKDYIAIFAGFTSEGWSNSLYLVDIDRLQIRLLENYGDPPAAGALMGMVYYKSGLYVYGFQESADPLSDTHTKLRKYDLNLGIWICLNPTEVLPVRVTGHTLAIMENFLYIFGGYDPVTGDVILKILKLDLDTLQWNFLNTSRTYLDFFAIQSKIQIDQFLYAAGGRGSDKNFNIIKKYDLLSPTLEFEILSENWNFPSPRKNHAMGRISNFFYIFGGQSNTGFLGDLWRFDMESLKWEEMSPSGNIPTPRAYCASLVIHGLGLFIFGGQGDSLYNSIYFYDFSINTWGLFIATGSAPSSRFSSCLTYAKLIYILGGKTIGDVSSEIWGYSPITNTFTLAKNLGTITIKLMNAICWSEVNPDHDIIYISSGEVSPQILNNNLYKLKIWEENNKLYYKVLSTYFDVYSLISNSETSQNLVGKYSLYFFGMAWSLFKKNNIAIFDYTENETKMLYANYSFYGHKTVHYRNKIFMYGGGMGKSGLKLPNEFSSNVFEIAFEDSDNFILPCSVGTIGENCTPCPAGTFYYNSTYCSPCGPGKYSTSLSATSGLVCTPCGFATFSDEYGGTSCKDCESGEICLPGSRKGKILTSKENQSIQPLKYNGKTLDITESIYPSLTILSLLIVVFFLIFKRKRHFLKKIDFYKANHSQEESKPIIAKSTEIGGIFSIFFIFAALATITISLYDLVNKNITEVKTLVPLVTITDEIVSKYVDFQVNFYNYGGFCINSQGDCLDEMSIEENTFEYTEKSVKCDFIDEVCSVKINYQGFRVASNSYFTISMNEYSAYTSYISLNATSYSSIPGEISSKLVYIFLDDNELIFKGSDPSIINLEFTSSVFYSESSLWPNFDSGYHIDNIGIPVVGSNTYPISFRSYPSMRFKVLLSKSSSALVTQRNYNLTALVFINTMLGSIFGLMQLIGFLMATCETAVDARNKSMNALKKVRKIKNFNKNISLNFEKKYKKCQKEISYFANSMKNFPNSIDTTRELF